MKLQAVPGVTVTVQVDGVALPEYEDADAVANDYEDQDINEDVRYIEATSGSEFSIYFKLDKNEFGTHGLHRDDAINCRIALDGTHAVDKIHRIRDYTGPTISRNYRGLDNLKNGRYVTEKFKFADLHTGRL